MAGLPGSRKENSLKIRAGLVLAMLLSAPVALRAQAQDPDMAQPPAAAGYVEISPRITNVHGRAAPVLGATALLGLPGGWKAGGTAVFLLKGVSVAPEELHMGWGGVLLESPARSLRALGPALWWTSVTVGAGNASIRDPFSGTRLRSDNFFILDPSASVGVLVLPRLQAAGLAGFRLALGVGGLGAVDGRALGGWTLGAALRFGPF